MSVGPTGRVHAFQQCAGQEIEPAHAETAPALQAGWHSPVPADAVRPRRGSGTGGSRTHNLSGFKAGRSTSWRTVPVPGTKSPGGSRTRSRGRSKAGHRPDSSAAEQSASRGSNPRYHPGEVVCYRLTPEARITDITVGNTGGAPGGGRTREAVVGGRRVTGYTTGASANAITVTDGRGGRGRTDAGRFWRPQGYRYLTPLEQHLTPAVGEAGVEPARSGSRNRRLTNKPSPR